MSQPLLSPLIVEQPTTFFTKESILGSLVGTSIILGGYPKQGLIQRPPSGNGKYGDLRHYPGPQNEGLFLEAGMDIIGVVRVSNSELLLWSFDGMSCINEEHYSRELVEFLRRLSLQILLNATGIEFNSDPLAIINDLQRQATKHEGDRQSRINPDIYHPEIMFTACITSVNFTGSDIIINTANVGDANSRKILYAPDTPLIYDPDLPTHRVRKGDKDVLGSYIGGLSNQYTSISQTRTSVLELADKARKGKLLVGSDGLIYFDSTSKFQDSSVMMRELITWGRKNTKDDLSLAIINLNLESLQKALSKKPFFTPQPSHQHQDPEVS